METHRARFICIWSLIATALVAGCQLGGTGERPYGPALYPPPEGPTVVDVSAGFDHGCALRQDRTVHCWGSNAQGQLGTEPYSGPPSAQDVPGLEDVQALSSGAWTTCALLGDQTVHCWGSNERGELGQPDLSPRTGPVTVQGLSEVVQLELGGATGCALRSDGTVWCWGVYEEGLPPGEDPANRLGLTQVVDATDMVQISVYGRTGCGVRGDSTVWCWNEVYPPVRSAYYHPTLSNVLTVEVALDDVVATHADRSMSWFKVSMYQQPPTMSQSSVWHRESFDHVVDFCMGASHNCLLRDDGTVFCRGNNHYGQVGAEDDDFPDGEVEITDIDDAVELECGSYSTCVIHSSGAVSCWGRNEGGALGDGSTINRYRPVWVTL
jgi:alpha-tubulin suppressor-like RCC1 family protein